MLGRVRRRVENVAGARPGSLEEALLYAQTYGDVWTDPAKKFLETVLDERARTKKAAAPARRCRAGVGRVGTGRARRLSLPTSRPAKSRGPAAACGYFLAAFSSASQSSIFFVRLSSSAVCSSSGFLSPANDSSSASG